MLKSQDIGFEVKNLKLMTLLHNLLDIWIILKKKKKHSWGFWMGQNNCGILELKVKPIRLNKEWKMVEDLGEDVGPMSEVQNKENDL